MCVHADSGGAGGVGYTLAWYNGGAGGPPTNGGGYLDKAVLENGPVLSDIERGCVVTCQNGTCTNGQSTTVCPPNTPQIGCNNWPPSSPMTYQLEYVLKDEDSVNKWTGAPNPSCGNNMVATTTSQNALWQQMSVDYTGGTQQPSFSYPNTAVSGWLCESLQNSKTPWNNATPEGGLFFSNFTLSSGPVLSLTLNGVTNCVASPEDVESGMVIVDNNPPVTGLQAIENDMVLGSSKSLSCKAAGALR